MHLAKSSCCRYLSRPLCAILAAVAAPAQALAHGVHADQPIALIDPLLTHHAVLEDELKLNFAASRSESLERTDVGAALEVAYAFSDVWGAEVFVPTTYVSEGEATAFGLGEVELQLPKVSFLRSYGFVLTALTALSAPTSTNALAPSEGWVFAPHLLSDVAVGAVGIQSNLAYEISAESALELRQSVAYTVELDHTIELFLSPLLEAVVEQPLHGAESMSLLISPGVKVAVGGWHCGAGAAVPIAGESDLDFLLMLQLGYHLVWKRLE